MAELTGAQELTLSSAGLDVVAGVFGYLASLNANSIASSRADMIRAAANADAQRYSEKAAADIAQQKVMYLASGVTLSGSPIDVLDKHAQLASQNMESMRMHGEIEALDQEQIGANELTKGRNALLGGVVEGARTIGKSPSFGVTATGFGEATPENKAVGAWLFGNGGLP